MYPRNSNYDFAKQLAAWTAIIMLFAQPLNLRASDCGCSGSIIQTAKNSCCGSAETTCCSSSVERSCCSSSTITCCSKNEGPKNSPCDCGEQCRCSQEQPSQSIPAVPANETQNEQSPSVALTLEVVVLCVTQPKSSFDRQVFSGYQPALTAQQTCALLSRFVV